MTDARTLLAQHDLGCQCWPHVSRKDALAAAAEADTLRERVAALEELVGEMVVDYHQTGLIRDHVDPGAKGWDVNKDWRICEDVLCEAARQLLAPTPATDEARCGTCDEPKGHWRHAFATWSDHPDGHPFQPTPTDEARCWACRGTGVNGGKPCTQCFQPTPATDEARCGFHFVAGDRCGHPESDVIHRAVQVGHGRHPFQPTPEPK